MCQLMAALSAFFAGITAIFSKIGIKKTDTDVALACRNVVVLLFAWGMVIPSGSITELSTLGWKPILFILLSGVTTVGAMICYFKALSQVDVNLVAPIDKSSTILTVLAAIVLFGETDNLWGKIIGMVIMLAGTLLMLERGRSAQTVQRSDAKKSWLFYAILSALMTAATSILAKLGLSEVEANLATALRTSVVVVLMFVVVFARGKLSLIPKVGKRELLFIALSGIATGAAWICYYYALQFGDVSVAAPIDKLSLLVTVGFSYLVFHEKLTKKAFAGMLLIVVGLVLMALI